MREPVLIRPYCLKMKAAHISLSFRQHLLVAGVITAAKGANEAR